MRGARVRPRAAVCATPAAGSTAAIRNGIMNFISLSFRFSQSVYLAYSPTKSTVVLFRGKKNLVFNKKLYEKIPRLHQHLVTLFRRQSHADTRQHTGHAGE